MKIIEINKNSFVFTEKKDYQLNVYTDGIVLEEICFIDLGKGKYIKEIRGEHKKIKETSEKITRNKKTIEKIKNDCAILINEIEKNL